MDHAENYAAKLHGVMSIILIFRGRVLQFKPQVIWISAGILDHQEKVLHNKRAGPFLSWDCAAVMTNEVTAAFVTLP